MIYFFSFESLLLLVVLLILIRLYINKKWSVLKKLNISHDPPSILTFGNLGDSMKDPDNLFAKDLERKARFGYVYGAYVGIHPRIVISDPKILKQIFIKEFSNFRDRQTLLTKCNGKELNNALFQSTGDQWKRLRHSLSPTFSGAKLKEMSPIIKKCVEKFLDNLSQAATKNNGRFNTKRAFGGLSIDILCSAGFSVDVHSQGFQFCLELELAALNPRVELVHQEVRTQCKNGIIIQDASSEGGKNVMKMAQTLSNVQFFGPLIFLFMMFPFTELIAEKLNYSIFGSKTTAFFRRLVDHLLERKEQYAKEKRIDIMRNMLELEVSEDQVKKDPVTKGLTRTEIVGNSMLMILAGYETTANSMIFFAYNLAAYPKVQEKLRQEIDETFEENGKLDYDLISGMKYLTMCLNESLRLYMPAVRNVRLAEKDITIDNIHIPAGVNVDVPVWGMNHDEEYWDEPYEYKPERMADMSKIDPMIFQPFGAGPRNCIGMRLALLEMKFAFCKLLQKFKLELCEDTPKPFLEVTFKASLQPKKEIYLQVVPRDTEE